jgi:hypothetical protein
MLQHHVLSRLDHQPLFLDLEQEQNRRPTQRILRYEIIWEREESLVEDIKKA